MNQLKLRPAQKSDIELIFKWSNDEEVRKNSFHTETIKWEEHVKWFNNIIDNRNVCFFILENNADPIGQIRIAFNETNKGIISFSINKEFRGLGFGNEILRLAEEELNKMNIKCELIGLVKINNLASQKAFLVNRYKEIKYNDKSMKYIKKI